jgi:hypothetical protein
MHVHKLLLILAIFTAPYGFASVPTDAKIYGKANLSVVNQDYGVYDEWVLNSNASRLGIKGKTVLLTVWRLFIKLSMKSVSIAVTVKEKHLNSATLLRASKAILV